MCQLCNPHPGHPKRRNGLARDGPPTPKATVPLTNRERGTAIETMMKGTVRGPRKTALMWGQTREWTTGMAMVRHVLYPEVGWAVRLEGTKGVVRADTM